MPATSRAKSTNRTTPGGTAVTTTALALTPQKASIDVPHCKNAIIYALSPLGSVFTNISEERSLSFSRKKCVDLKVTQLLIG